jgi:hypothetical protein
MRRRDAAAMDGALPQDTRIWLAHLLATRLDTAIGLNQLGILLQNQGDLDGARKHVEQALELWQAGHILYGWHGGQGSFFQLGALAVESGRVVHGVCLIATGVIICREMGQSDAEQEQRILTTYTDLLGSEEQMDALVHLAREEYRSNRGRQLIRAAFAA